jgi:hypothetical protein
MREYLKRWPWGRRIRLLNLELRNRFLGLPNWAMLRKADTWSSALATARGPKVLVATSVGLHTAANSLDSVLAVALGMRGARVHSLLCDQILPACLACERGWYPDPAHFVAHGPAKSMCGACYRPADRMWDSVGVTGKRLGKYLTDQDRRAAWRLAATIPASEIDNMEHMGVRVGMHARSGTLRYFASGTLEKEPDAEPVRRRYLAAALMATKALDKLLREERYDVCVAHHGLYIPQGLLVDLCRQHDVRLVTWNIAYRAGSFIFSHDDTYHFTLMNEAVSSWESLSWGPGQQQALDGYMRARATGAMDWVSYQDGTGQSIDWLTDQLGITFDKPTVSAFTNVLWDAQVFYQSNAFPSMLDWLFETVRYFAQRSDIQLVIRVHPAEIQNAVKSRQTVVAELARAFVTLPPNVLVIPPDVRVNSYALAKRSNAAIIYGTKMGIELAYLGIPTIVAGESWARNKGFTLDATSRADYLALLDRLPLSHGLDEAALQRAARYAFHFFFRRTIPLEFLTVKKGAWPPFRVALDSVEPLLPGRSRGLDVICDGILEGTPFIYPAEDILAHAGELSHPFADHARANPSLRREPMHMPEGNPPNKALARGGF